MIYYAKRNEEGAIELFVEETALDMDDNVISIKKSVGTYNSDELNAIKADLEERLAMVNDKITAINLLNEE